MAREARASLRQGAAGLSGGQLDDVMLVGATHPLLAGPVHTRQKCPQGRAVAQHRGHSYPFSVDKGRLPCTRPFGFHACCMMKLKL